MKGSGRVFRIKVSAGKQSTQGQKVATINMRQMQINQSGKIASIKVTGELARRIRDMGLTPGTEVVIRGRAPLSDPVALRVRGFTLSLRNSEADYIDVEVE